MNPPKLFVCGHSHILKVMYDHALHTLVVNPGAAGTYGQQTVRTLMRFTLDNGQIKDMEVIELK
jgi:predicted phosphodiesterase